MNSSESPSRKTAREIMKKNLTRSDEGSYYTDRDDLEDDITQALDAAVAEERERAAGIAEHHCVFRPAEEMCCLSCRSHEIAKAIRERGKNE